MMKLVTSGRALRNQPDFTSRRFSVVRAADRSAGDGERLSASVTYSQIDKLLHVFKFDHDGQ